MKGLSQASRQRQRPLALFMVVGWALASPTAAALQGSAPGAIVVADAPALGGVVAWDAGVVPDVGDDRLVLEPATGEGGVALRVPVGPAVPEIEIDATGLRAPMVGVPRVGLETGDWLLEPRATDDGLFLAWRAPGVGPLPATQGTTAPLAWPSPAWYVALPFALRPGGATVEPRFAEDGDATVHEADHGLWHFCARMRTSGLPPDAACEEGGFAAMAGRLAPHVVVGAHVAPLQVAVQPGSEGGGTADAPARTPASSEGAAGQSLRGASEAARSLASAMPAAVAPLPMPAEERSPPASAWVSSAGLDALGTAPGADLAALALVGLGLVALAVPVYHRIGRQRLLDLPLRARLLDLLRAQPGIYESAAARALGVGPTGLQYHVHILAKHGILEVHRVGGRKRLVLAGQLAPAEKAVVFARAGSSAAVLALLARETGLSQRQMAARLGVRETTIRWHLERLVREGVVTVARDGPRKVASLAPHARAAPAPEAAMTKPQEAAAVPTMLPE